MARACPKCGKSFADNIFFCGFDGSITLQEQNFRDIDPRIGSEIMGYVLVARIADGAMGRIYEGRHAKTRQRVAIKVLHQGVAEDHVALERFRREFDTARSLDHRHVLRVADLGQTRDGTHFIVMEYLVGHTLRWALDRHGALPAARWLRIAAQMATALDHAHSFGVIHRDLKPENIFLCESAQGDDVRLLDFGSVKLQIDAGQKLTQFGTTVGSPYYMSPEQAMGMADLDARSDVFALAAIVYEMATGKVAFDADDIASIMLKVVEGERPRVTDIARYYSKHLDDAVIAGMRRNKQDRTPDVLELVQQIATSIGVDLPVEQIAHTSESQLRPRAAPSIVPLTKSKSPTPKQTSLIPNESNELPSTNPPPEKLISLRPLLDSIRPSLIPHRRSSAGLIVSLLVVLVAVFAAVHYWLDK